MVDERLRVRIGTDLKGFESGLRSATSKATKWGKRLGLAFVAGLTTAAIIGAKFQQTLIETATVAQAYGKDLKALEDKARSLGKTTAFTATQAAKGMYDLASAGLDTREIIDATEHSMKLAGATGSEMTQATGLLASSLKQFGLDASESKRIVDTYAGAITNSQLTMERLTEAMRYAGTTGSSLGWTIEETTAAVAQFADLGLVGSMAGTNLRMSMINLKKGTDKAKNALSALGLTLEDVNPETYTFGEIIKTLGERGLTAAQAISIFGSRSGMNMKKLSQLAAAGKTDFEAFVESLEDAQKGVGRTTEMYDRMMNTFRGKWKILMSAIQDLAIEAFGTFESEGRDAFGFITEEVKKLTAKIVENKEKIKESVNEVIGVFKSLYEILKDATNMSITLGRMLGIPEIAAAIREVGNAYNAATTDVDTFMTAVIRNLARTDETDRLNELVEKTEWSLKVRTMAQEKYHNDLIKMGTDYDQSLLLGWGEFNTEYLEKLSERRKKEAELAKKRAKEEKELIEGLRKWEIEKATEYDNALMKGYRSYIEADKKKVEDLKQTSEEFHQWELKQTEQNYLKLFEFARRHRETMRIHGLEGIELIKEQNQMALEAVDQEFNTKKALFARNNKILTDLTKMHSDARTTIEVKNAERVKEAQKQIWRQRVSHLLTMTGQAASLVDQMEQAGVLSAKKAFRARQAFAIVEAIINTAAGIMQALGTWPPPISWVLAGITAAMGATQVALIASQREPVSYDLGGTSSRGEIYQSNVPEAHIPLPSGGRIPVQIQGGGGRPIVIFQMNRPVFQDLATQQATMALISKQITTAIAPAVIKNNYDNDGIIRSMIRNRT